MLHCSNLTLIFLYWITCSKRISNEANYTSANWYVFFYIAFSINATRTGTWIATFLINTCVFAITFRVNRTFWSAKWWLPQIIWQTRTWWITPGLLAFWIWTTRGWQTRVAWFGRSYVWYNLRYGITTYKRIASEMRFTCANRTVISNVALRVFTTYTWTRILTFLFNARFLCNAIWIRYTFGPACWWFTNVITLARTDRLVIQYFTLWIWTTRWRLARVNVFFCN